MPYSYDRSDKTAGFLISDEVTCTGKNLEIKAKLPQNLRDRWDEVAVALKRKGAKVSDTEVGGTIHLKIII